MTLFPAESYMAFVSQLCTLLAVCTLKDTFVGSAIKQARKHVPFSGSLICCFPVLICCTLCEHNVKHPELYAGHQSGAQGTRDSFRIFQIRPECGAYLQDPRVHPPADWGHQRAESQLGSGSKLCFPRGSEVFTDEYLAQNGTILIH